jgi:hypothetical protein
MATQVNPAFRGEAKSMVQRITAAIGLCLIVVGLAGVMMPGLFGMHLSFTHNLMHLASGALGFWTGYAENSKLAKRYCIAFGVAYGVLGVAGFIIGQPGYPAVGHLEAEQYLLRVIPNVLEFGGSDHLFHMLLSAALLFTGIFGQSEKTNK